MSAAFEPDQDTGAPPGLFGRVALIGAILFTEKFLLNFLVDFEAAQSASGLGAWVRSAQHWGFRFLVTFAVSLALFGWIRNGTVLRRLNAAAKGRLLRTPLLLLHVALVLPLIPLSNLLYGSHAVHLPFWAVVVLWAGFASAAIVALCLGFAPLELWRSASRAVGWAWAYALVVAGLAACAMEWSQRLWAPTAALTFNLVRWVLAPILPTLSTEPAELILYTPNFAIQVSDICSGLEGVGLMLAFCGAWLFYCRRELNFPRALLLVPGGLLLIFGLNVIRIAALMVIGDAGLTDVAVYGFHSQAGWIAFNASAGVVAFVSKRSAWLRQPASGEAREDVANPTAAYLVPLLVVLGGRMIVIAVSGSSGAWYPVPALAAAVALWHYRREWSALVWRYSWRGAAAGLGVFVVWMLAARWLLPAGTAQAPARAGEQFWIGWWTPASVLGTVLIVPLAEELAYRGYLMRRLVAADFTAVRFEAVRFTPLFVTALVFGAAHGAMWLPAVTAGLAFGALATRTGSMGEAVCAHIVTNGLLMVTTLLARN